MEQYYYNHMNKPQQAAYHSIFVGVKNLSDEIQVPALSGEELYNIFFQMRLDHPEIFWVTNFKLLRLRTVRRYPSGSLSLVWRS